MSDTHYTTYTIAVHLDLSADPPNQLVLNDNPRIPHGTIGILAWVASPNSDPFDFLRPEFCATKQPPPIAIPVLRGPAMVTLVSNLESSDVGTWAYRIGVRPTAEPGKPVWTPDCLDAYPQPNDDYQAFMAVSGPIIINTGV